MPSRIRPAAVGSEVYGKRALMSGEATKMGILTKRKSYHRQPRGGAIRTVRWQLGHPVTASTLYQMPDYHVRFVMFRYRYFKYVSEPALFPAKSPHLSTGWWSPTVASEAHSYGYIPIPMRLNQLPAYDRKRSRRHRTVFRNLPHGPAHPRAARRGGSSRCRRPSDSEPRASPAVSA